MAANDLPDEIVREILAPALRVSDAEFTDTTSPNSFQSKISESSSAFLLVCKRWLRVGTPLLYEVIVVRSKAQAQYLHIVLRANKAFGQYTRKLRVEGGFGSIMDGIISATPHITARISHRGVRIDLFLSLDIYSSDSSAGLVKALPKVNPQRLTLHNGPTTLNNAQTTKLSEAVCKAFKKWSNTTTLIVDSHNLLYSSHNARIASAVPLSSSLETIILRHRALYHVSAKVLFIYASCPSIKSIQLFSLSEDISRDLERTIKNNPVLKSIVTVINDVQNSNSHRMCVDHKPILSSAGLASVALSSASLQDREVVFARIIFFYLRLDQLSFHVQASDFPFFRVGSRRVISLVSKMFHRLSLPYLYGYPTICSTFQMKLFCTSVIGNPSLVELIFDGWWTADRKPAPSRSGVLAHASNLKQLSAVEHDDRWGRYWRHNIGWNAFQALAQAAGSKLQKFEDIHIDPPRTAQLCTIFQEFTQLRSLHWNTNTSFKELTATKSLVECFKTLEALTVGIHDASFFEVLAMMDLPVLCSLAITSNLRLDGLDIFLCKHGSKLRTLTATDSSFSGFGHFELFDMCPALVTLEFSHIVEPPPRSFFHSTTPHNSLVKFIMAKKEIDSHCPKNWHFINNSPAWTAFFATVDFSSFPLLRELHMPGHCVWPTGTERDIAKSVWPARADRLAGLNISLTDSKGSKWKPRLQRVNGRLNL